MSSVVISGDTSGAITLAAPAVAGTNTITLPASTGTAVIGSAAVSAVGQIPFSTDGISYTPTAKIVASTAVASTSGTSITFTGIPSWVKRITVILASVSSSGTSALTIQVGTSGGFVTTGYLCGAVYSGTSTGGGNSTTGLMLNGGSKGSGNVVHGTSTLTNITSNTWVSSHAIGQSDSAYAIYGGGSISAGGAVTQVRLTTNNGTDTFTGGTVNIFYE